MTALSVPRILVAVHGWETPAWAAAACRVLATWSSASVRVLAVLDVPSPSFTSLTPFARRAWAGARAEWSTLERRRLDDALAALTPGLPRGAEIFWTSATAGDVAGAIADQARAWPADVVVVGAPAPTPMAWLRPGPVHQRVVRLADCAVLIVTPQRPVGGRRRLLPVPQPATAGRGA